MTHPKMSPSLWFVGIVASLPLLYALSFGPAIWLCDHGILALAGVARAYRPLILTTFDGPFWAGEAVETYAGFWTPRYSIPVSPPPPSSGCSLTACAQVCGTFEDLRRNVGR